LVACCLRRSQRPIHQSDPDARADDHLNVHYRPDTVTDANVHADSHATDGSTHPAADCRADSP
jgi:hypothetical protein